LPRTHTFYRRKKFGFDIGRTRIAFEIAAVIGINSLFVGTVYFDFLSEITVRTPALFGSQAEFERRYVFLGGLHADIKVRPYDALVRNRRITPIRDRAVCRKSRIGAGRGNYEFASARKLGYTPNRKLDIEKRPVLYNIVQSQSSVFQRKPYAAARPGLFLYGRGDGDAVSVGFYVALGVVGKIVSVGAFWRAPSPFS